VDELTSLRIADEAYTCPRDESAMYPRGLVPRYAEGMWV